MDHPASPLPFEDYWAEHFAQRYADELAHEASLRDDAFAPTTLTVAGLELRPMTASDLLLLHGLANPFVSGGPLTPAAIAQFLAVLVEPAPQGWWRRRRFFRQVDRLPYTPTCAAIKAYVARMFASSGVRMESPASQSDGRDHCATVDLNFLVPLIVQIACETGWSEADILAQRIDRLFQYRLALDLRAGRRPPLNRAERLKSECLAAYDQYLKSLPAPSLATPLTA